MIEDLTMYIAVPIYKITVTELGFMVMRKSLSFLKKEKKRKSISQNPSQQNPAAILIHENLNWPSI